MIVQGRPSPQSDADESGAGVSIGADAFIDYIGRSRPGNTTSSRIMLRTRAPLVSAIVRDTPQTPDTLFSMSFGLARGKTLDAGFVGRTSADLPALPDDPALLGCVRFDPRVWFDEPNRPFEMEIGSGKGPFLIAAAPRRPEANFLGIEWTHEFWLYSADRCRRRQLANVRLLHADATEFLQWRAPDEFVDVLHLYYSDPWPKKKHHKRRVVQHSFLAQAHRALRPGGQLRIATDHDDYWRWMEERFATWCDKTKQGARFDRLDDKDAIAAIRLEGADALLVGTNYERKFTSEQSPPHAAVLVKPIDPGREAPSDH